MRLIDADELKQYIIAFTEAGYGSIKIDKIVKYIDGQSTAYNVDKVVELLQKEKYSPGILEQDETYNIAIENAIKIVRSAVMY